MILNKSQILELLPHRDPFCFVDSVDEYSQNKSIKATFFLNPNLAFFAGHFPNNPIMPGVLIIEALAQTSGLLIALDAKNSNAQDTNSLRYLASNNIKLIAPANPPEMLFLKSAYVKSFNGLHYFAVEAFTDKKSVAAGTLVLADAENVK